MNELLTWILAAVAAAVVLLLLVRARRRQQTERVEAERHEGQRLAQQHATRPHQAADPAQAQADAQALREVEDAVAHRLAQQRAEEERIEAERVHAERDEAARLEAQAQQAREAAAVQAQRLAEQRAEQRAEAQRQEAERQAREAAEQAAREAEARRLAEEQAEHERLAREQAAREAAKAERLEAERVAREAEALRLAAEDAAREAAARQRAEQQAAEAAALAAAAEAERAAAEAAAAAAAAQPTRELRADETLVLVADDSKIVRVKISRLLTGQTYRVALAESGEQALALLAAERPHVVITDVEMPGIDGFELTRQVRATPAWAELPVLMITSSDDKRDQAEAAGVTQLLGKPYSEEALIAAIERARLAVRVPV